LKEKKIKKENVSNIKIEGVKAFTVGQVARMLGITTLTTRNFLREQRLIGQKVGRSWVITLPNLQNFISGAWAGRSKKKKK